MAEPEDGYPDSPPEDLDPGPDQFESLDDADRELGEEHRFEPEGRRPEGSLEDEDQRLDAHDADDLANSQWTPQILGGKPRVDEPNFNDNEADWSRDRS
jgi:hypothetical protein